MGLKECVDGAVCFEDRPLTPENFHEEFASSDYFELNEILENLKERKEEIRKELILLDTQIAVQSRTRIKAPSTAEKTVQNPDGVGPLQQILGGLGQMLQEMDGRRDSLIKTMDAIDFVVRSLDENDQFEPTPPRIEIPEKRIISPNSEVVPIHGHLVGPNET
jgi:hypothetical protein